MSKRSITEVQPTSHHGQPFQKVSVGAAKREDIALEEMGEFEDAWEDEVDSEEEVIEGNDNTNDGTSTFFSISLNIHDLLLRHGCR